MHRWNILWALHKVHHSATALTPMTVFRTHPLEGVIFSFRGAITQAVTISSFIFLFGNNVDLITILGANIFSFLFNIFGSNLRHSHIGIKYWKWLEYLIISPAQHQVHHSISKKHYDKNFGVTFAFWDFIFGSHYHSEDTDNLTLGIGNHAGDEIHTLANLYFKPIFEIFNILKKKINKFKNYFQKKFILKRA
jgi:sterol desaturase/sphingolipid hydroxylase (fatty acid hydroxylase superfamily)